jgi:Domain of unknown function (DUF4260)
MALHSATQPAQATQLSMPRILLQLEGLALLAGALALYSQQGFSWWLFAIFLLAPDLFAAGYLINTRIGAYGYNLVHTTVFPIGLAIISFYSGWDVGIQAALIWFAHIGMDRAIGYGLKYPEAFKETHLGRI